MRDKMRVYFGLDFGTTNSALVGIRKVGNTTSFIKFQDEAGNPFPSLVLLHKVDGTIKTGREAWRNQKALSDDYYVIHSIKSIIDTNKSWNVGNKKWTPIEVAGEIFKALKKQVSDRGYDLREAMVSIPVGFSSSKRICLREAAKLAGIEIVDFVSESTAAVFNNYTDVKDYSKVAVFDWGGGTLDVSILDNVDGSIAEIATAGLSIGGDDINKVIATQIHRRISKKYSLGKSFDNIQSNYQDNMLVECERAKKDLSSDELASIFLIDYDGVSEVIDEEISYEIFELMTKDIIDEAIKFFEDTVHNAGLSLDEIDCVIMVGGSTNLLPLYNKASEKWEEKHNIEVYYPEETGWDVAIGTAKLCVKSGDYTINDEISVILSDDKTHFPIINKGQKVDSLKSVSFRLIEDDQYAIFKFAANRELKSIKFIETYGFLDEKLDCSVYIDENRVLNIDIKSNRKPDSYLEKWVYPTLNFRYNLPIDWEV